MRNLRYKEVNLSRVTQEVRELCCKSFLNKRMRYKRNMSKTWERGEELQLVFAFFSCSESLVP